MYLIKTRTKFFFEKWHIFCLFYLYLFIQKINQSSLNILTKNRFPNQRLFQHNEIAILMRFFKTNYQITTTMMELLTMSIKLCDIIFVFAMNISKKYVVLYSCGSSLLHIFPADQLPAGRLLRNWEQWSWIMN